MNVCCLISFRKGHNFTEIQTQLSKVIILYMQISPHKHSNDPSLASFRLVTSFALTLVIFQLKTNLVSQAAKLDYALEMETEPLLTRDRLESTECIWGF